MEVTRLVAGIGHILRLAEQPPYPGAWAGWRSLSSLLMLVAVACHREAMSVRFSGYKLTAGGHGKISRAIEGLGYQLGLAGH